MQDTENLVGLSGLEPPTSRLSGVRSNRLSYRPMQGFSGFKFFSYPTFFQYFIVNVHVFASQKFMPTQR